jgi:hypothetical protein
MATVTIGFRTSSQSWSRRLVVVYKSSHLKVSRKLLGREADGEVTTVEKAELDVYERLEHLLVMIRPGNL